MRPNLLLLRLLAIAGPALALAVAADPAAAQADFSRVVEGSVVDASSGEPLPGAIVLVEPAPGGVASPERATGAVRRGWSATTAEDGAYRLLGLPAGEYLLHVSRPGYRSTRVRVRVDRPEPARVSVGLMLEPVPMEPVSVVLHAPPRVEKPLEAVAESRARVALERYRRARHLPEDVRGVSNQDVIEAITLAESDIFRALQRLPGVTTRDDFTAELWTRGAPWSHTRVLFDGLPLYSPLHGAGVFSGVNADAIDAAFFHPGARPASMAGGAAAVIDLASRIADPEPDLDGRGELSLVSARLAMDRAFDSGGWMLAGRRTYLDVVTWAIEELAGAEDVYVPYAFQDLTGRLDLDLGGGRSLEASLLWASDVVRGDVPDVLEDSPSKWGSLAARVTLETPWRGLVLRHTAGTSRFGAEGLREDFPGLADPVVDPDIIQTTGVATDQTMEHWTAGTSIAPATVDARNRWSAGVAVVGQRQSYQGPSPSAHPGLTSVHPISIDADLAYGTAWAERRLAPHAALEVDLGLRVDLGGAHVDGATARPAPRVALRWSPAGARFSMSGGWSRIYQYEQVLAPAGFSVGPRLHPNELWLVAGDSVPALSSDIVTVGVETWIGERWIGSATVYGRVVDGVTVPDPTEGPIVNPVTFTTAQNRATGVELSLRRLFGRWTASLGYALARSTLESAGIEYPAPTERRHSVDAVVSTKLGRGWRVGAAWAWSSGAPFTRFLEGEFDCDSWPEAPCDVVRPPVAGPPGGERGPAFTSLDLGADWTKDHGSWTMAAFLQVRNALNRANDLTYVGSVPECQAFGGICDPDPVFVDEFDSGLPILPSAGLRFTF